MIRKNMSKFIEVKDALGEDCLIDPLSVIAVEQIKENSEIKTIVYFNKLQMELNESYESLKNKLDEAMNYY